MRVGSRRSAQAPMRASCAIKRASGAQWRAPLAAAFAWVDAAAAAGPARARLGALSLASTVEARPGVGTTGSAGGQGPLRCGSIGDSWREDALYFDTFGADMAVVDTFYR